MKIKTKRLKKSDFDGLSVTQKKMAMILNKINGPQNALEFIKKFQRLA